MPSHVIMEFRLNRTLPIGGGLVAALNGAGFLVFYLTTQTASAGFLPLGLSMLTISAILFTLRIVVRMDNRTGRIERTIRTLLWTRRRGYSVSDFSAVGVGMAGGSGRFARHTWYLVQLVGPTNVNIPGVCANREAIIGLAERVADYLDLPVDRKPMVVFFQERWDWGSS